ncbi:acyl carrier protein [Streptomyces sp. NBRC 110028]|uniref:acyl carrier protein n=1 Tax=Streptomyces sp. NBRC 110028 TaxID=1621260 RepID=UPI0006E295B8|nr:phosphopantetheine-binding protein [Streptomyces sp. NBRC 110028]
MTTVTEEIQGFLTSVIGQEVGPDEDYFATGLTDSLFALELVTFAEQKFDLAVDVDDLNLDNFRTAARIAAFIRRKNGSGCPEASHETSR